MTSLLSVTFDRTSLSLPPLVAANTPGSTFLLPEDSVTIGASFRKEYAPQSRDQPGRVLLAVVEDPGPVDLVIYVYATSDADLTARKNELRAALAQVTYALTIEQYGAEYAFEAECEPPAWGAYDSGMASQHMARCSVSVPVNPI